MFTIELGNLRSEEQVKKVKAAVDGKSFMNFKVEYGIYEGNYPTTVLTSYDEFLSKHYEENPEDLEKDGSIDSQITNMLLFCLAEAI